MPKVNSTPLPRLCTETSPIMYQVKRPPPPSPSRKKPVSNVETVPIPNVYAPYPPPLTSVPIPPRVNPLRPAPPERQTISLETEDPTYHNHQRTDLMARREHFRIHNLWSRYYYGNTSEKEIYRRYIRQGLKQQMTERWEKNKQDFWGKVKESEIAVQKDKDDVEREIVSSREKLMLSTQFRDANKQMMEDKERRMMEERSFERVKDREQLRYNPINWSGSLI